MRNRAAVVLIAPFLVAMAPGPGSRQAQLEQLAKESHEYRERCDAWANEAIEADEKRDLPKLLDLLESEPGFPPAYRLALQLILEGSALGKVKTHALRFYACNRLARYGAFKKAFELAGEFRKDSQNERLRKVFFLNLLESTEEASLPFDVFFDALILEAAVDSGVISVSDPVFLAAASFVDEAKRLVDETDGHWSYSLEKELRRARRMNDKIHRLLLRAKGSQ
jgi:hypothetical protein